MDLLRSAGEILGWYLHWRRLPWRALVAFALAIFNIALYESSRGALPLISGSLCWGLGVYMAAIHYMDLGRWPRTVIETRRSREAAARWLAELTPRERTRVSRLSESMHLLASAGTIPAKQAIENMKAVTTAMHKAPRG